MTLDDIVTYIANVVAKRAANGNNFGTVLIPEGLIEFIPAMKKLIAELNDLLAQPEAAEVAADEQRAWILGKLSSENAAIYESLPRRCCQAAHHGARPARKRTGFSHRNRKTPF